MTAKVNIWSKVDTSGTCWFWQGYIMPNGYGMLGRKLVHRLVYEQAKGLIPVGLEIDHICRNRKRQVQLCT